jgi:hypothetical protein
VGTPADRAGSEASAPIAASARAVRFSVQSM